MNRPRPVSKTDIEIYYSKRNKEWFWRMPSEISQGVQEQIMALALGWA